MTDTISAYPLTWPPGKPRTEPNARRHGRFSREVSRSSPFGGNRYQTKEPVTVHQAIQRVKAQADAYTRAGHRLRIDPDDMIFSTNLRAKSDGTPYATQKKVEDPGVAVYFRLDGKDMCIAVDTYTTVADNLAAVAAVLDALRALERHGSGLVESAFTGFAALPSPDGVQGWNWRDTLQYDGDDLSEAREAYRRLAARAHPDRGGDPNTFDTINKAWTQAKEALGRT